MNITDVQINLADENNGHLMGFANIIVDNDFIIHDLKIIREKTRYFIAMPSRKRSDHCSNCSVRTALTDKFCHECGKPLGKANYEDRSRVYVDVAHPLNPQCRSKIERTVLTAYLRKVETVKQPNYDQENEQRQAV